MKTKHLLKLTSLLFIILQFSSFKSYAELSNQLSIKESQLAQESYLKNDGTSLLQHIKKALITSENHPMIIENLIPLYKKAQETGLLDTIQLDWTPPKGIKYLTITVGRRYLTDSRQTRFSLAVGGIIEKTDLIEQLQVIKFPNRVILDKQSNIGEFGEQKYKDEPSFWLSEKSHFQTVEEGLYLINIKTKDEKMVQGWFIITNENSSSSPLIIKPENFESFSTTQPQFQWINYISPEKQKNDKTKIMIKVTQDNPEYKEIIVADLKFNPDAKDYFFNLGNCQNCENWNGPTKLKMGSYYFNVKYSNKHKLSEIYMNRTTTTIVPFNITTKE